MCVFGSLQEHDASSAGGRAIPSFPQHRTPGSETGEHSPGRLWPYQTL